MIIRKIIRKNKNVLINEEGITMRKMKFKREYFEPGTLKNITTNCQRIQEVTDAHMFKENWLQIRHTKLERGSSSVLLDVIRCCLAH